MLLVLTVISCRNAKNGNIYSYFLYSENNKLETRLYAQSADLYCINWDIHVGNRAREKIKKTGGEQDKTNKFKNEKDGKCSGIGKKTKPE